MKNNEMTMFKFLVVKKNLDFLNLQSDLNIIVLEVTKSDCSTVQFKKQGNKEL